MRFAAGILLLPLIGCGRVEDPRYIQGLLDKTPIPLGRLREALAIRPGELDIVGAAAPDVFDRSPRPLWAVRNQGTRPLWLHRGELRVRGVVQVPLLHNPTMNNSMRLGWPGLRPSFKASDWVLLLPSEQIPLETVVPEEWGGIEWRVALGEEGLLLCDDAEAFNVKGGGTSGHTIPLERTLGKSFYPPPYDWSGPLGMPDIFELELRFDAAGLLATEITITAVDVPSQGLALRGWVVGEDDRLVYQGRLDIVSHQASARKVGTRYRIPAELPSGPYRLLALAQDAGQYVRGDLSGPAISRWIPFRVGTSASAGNRGGAAPRD